MDSLSFYPIRFLFLLALIPVTFFWLRRAYRILIKRDFSEVALKRGVAPPNAEKWAPYEMALNLVGGAIMVCVLLAALVFGALTYDQWVAIAGSTLWIKLFLSFAISRQAHGFGPGRKRGAPKAASPSGDESSDKAGAGS